MNIQEFIKAKEEELLPKKYKFIASEYPDFEEDYKKDISQSLLEYNEKIKKMVESKKISSEFHLKMIPCPHCAKNDTLDDIITNLTLKDNE